MQQKWQFPVLVAGLALGLGGPAAAAGAQPQEQVIRMTLQKQSLDGREPLGFGACQWLSPTNAPPERLQSVLRFKSSRPRWYAARFGDTQDNLFSVVIDESGGTGSGYDTVYVDSNNDNRLDPKMERHGFPLSTTTVGHPIYLEFQIVAGGKTNTHLFHFTAFPYSDARTPKDIHANLRNGSYWVGHAVFNGVERRVALADLDSNGIFNDTEQALFFGERFFVELPGKKGPEQDSPFTSYPYGEFTCIAGSWYSVVATPDGSEVTITPASPHFGSVKAPPRITRATLRSPRQTLYLNFSNAVEQAIVGTYKLASLSLREERGGDTGLELSADYPERPPEIRIREGETFALTAGPPLRIEVQPHSEPSTNKVVLSLVLVGTGGETYRWTRQANRSAPKPAFEIRDADGKLADSGSFEYG
jgi:hypothetical protein